MVWVTLHPPPIVTYFPLLPLSRISHYFILSFQWKHRSRVYSIELMRCKNKSLWLLRGAIILNKLKWTIQKYSGTTVYKIYFQIEVEYHLQTTCLTSGTIPPSTDRLSRWIVRIRHMSMSFPGGTFFVEAFGIYNGSEASTCWEVYHSSGWWFAGLPGFLSKFHGEWHFLSQWFRVPTSW